MKLLKLKNTVKPVHSDHWREFWKGSH